MTKAELNFYAALAHAVYPELVVFPKMRVTDLINPIEHRYSSNGAKAWNAIAQKHVDFVLCHSASLEVAGIVELDDRSHDRADRRKRDQLIDQAFTEAGLRILHIECQPSYSQPETRRIILQELGIAA
ncbi:MAG: topA [Limisphaerales bacterium]|nr:MAG: topA [Limisphaerales bacterium]KAG0509167.1 MAG: topA [Limisphaerales bacterium]TXT52493.1 MAG: topA [Limisphaerales bacterium]